MSALGGIIFNGNAQYLQYVTKNVITHISKTDNVKGDQQNEHSQSLTGQESKRPDSNWDLALVVFKRILAALPLSYVSSQDYRIRTYKPSAAKPPDVLPLELSPDVSAPGEHQNPEPTENYE